MALAVVVHVVVAPNTAMAIAYIGLGANIDSPKEQIVTALHTINSLETTQLIDWSSLYQSKPLGPDDQPDYTNAVAAIDTRLSSMQLLDALQNIEKQQGRVKYRHWGERCIDLDILLFGTETLSSERLNIPHHELKNRSFVVQPLLEIAPDLALPDGTMLAEVSPAFNGDLMRQQRPVIDL